MGLFTSLIKNTSNTFFRKHRRGLIILLAIFLILAGINYFVEKYTGKIVGPMIKELIIEKSNGMYHAEFSKMGIVLNSGVFYVNDFSISVDSVTFRANQSGPHPEKIFVSTRVPRLYIRVANLLAVYMRRELRITGIESDHPQIDILKLEKDTAKAESKFNFDDPYKMISDYLTVFQINDFSIKEGSFRIYAPYAADYENYEVNNISIQIKNFLLDKYASKNKDKFFYTDNVELEIRDQSLFLPDSLHEITFDRLFISTISKNVEINNFKLRERPRMSQTSITNSRVNRMYFIIPLLKLNGVDFIRAYNEQILEMERILLDRPDIKFVSSGIKKTAKGDKPAHSPANVMQYIIRSLSVDTLTINNGNIDITLKNQGASTRFSVENMSLGIQKIKIDSVGPPHGISNITYKTIDLELNNGKFVFPGHTGKVTMTSLKAVSNPLNLELTGMDYQAFRTSNQKQFVTSLDEQRNLSLEMLLPGIRIKSFDLMAFINEKLLKISEINIDEPAIMLCGNAKVNKEKKPFNLEKWADPYALIKKSLKAAYIGAVNVNNARFQKGNCKAGHASELLADGLDIRARQIRIDSSAAPPGTLLGAENWFINCHNLKYNLHDRQKEILVRGLEFESKKGLFSTAEMALFSTTDLNGNTLPAPRQNVRLDNINLNGIDVQDFLRTGFLSLDTFSISSVYLDLDAGKSKKRAKAKGRSSPNPGILKNITLKMFLIRSGNANIKRQGETLFHANNIFLGLDHISYTPGTDKSLNLNMGKMDINLDNYSFYLKKIEHRVTGKQISLHSGNKTAILSDLRLIPLSREPGRNIYDVTIPAIKVSGFDLSQILFDSTFICSSVLISQPVINLSLERGPKKAKTPKTNGKKPLPHPMKIIRADEIKLINGNIKIKETHRDSTQLIDVQNINFTLSDVDVDSAGIISKNKLLYSENIDLLADYITLYKPGEKQFMNINHLNFSTANRMLEADGFYYSNNTGKTTANRNKLKVDLGTLKISDLDIKEIFNAHRINLGEIVLTRPRLVLEQMKKEKKSGQKTGHGKFVYPFDSSMVRSVQVRSILLQKGKFDFIVKSPSDTVNPDNQLYVTGVDLSVKKIHLTPEKHYTLSTSSFINSFNLNVRKVRYDLPDKLNRIEIGGITLNSADTTLVVSDFALIPKVDKYKYGPAKGFQTDWIHLTNKKLTVSNIHLNKLLFEKKLITPSITLDGLRVFVFRDKRVPFVEVYKPLPPEQLRNLSTLLRIDSLTINDGNVVYQEFGEKSKAPGEIYITDMNGMLYNITNDTSVLAKQPKLFLGAQAAFAGKGLIKLQVVFDLPDTSDVFYMGLILADLDLRELNRMLAPTAFVKVKSGYDKNLIMTAKANNDYAYGEMRFYYNDLKIAVLNKKTETPKGLGNALLSFFANSFFINSNNPKLLKLRKGEVFFERNKYKSIFNYWVKTFLSGVVTSIGAKSNKKQIQKIQEAQLKKFEPITAPE